MVPNPCRELAERLIWKASARPWSHVHWSHVHREGALTWHKKKKTNMFILKPRAEGGCKPPQLLTATCVDLHFLLLTTFHCRCSDKLYLLDWSLTSLLR